METGTELLEKETKINNACENTNQAPPYHIFTVLGNYFVFDTTGCRFYEIDAPTYRMLDLCLSKSFSDAEEIIRNEAVFPSYLIDSVVASVDILSKNGLFDVPDFSISEEEIERQLETIIPSPLYRVELILSEDCNMACSYCYSKTCRDTEKCGMMTIDVAKKAVDMLFLLSDNRKEIDILFFGGEPLLNKKVLRFVVEYSQKLAEIHNKSVTYRITTNGTLLDNEIIDYINKHKIGVMVSLDGDKELHNSQCRMRDGRESYDLVIKNIENLLATRDDVFVRCTMTHPTPCLEKLVHGFELLGFSEMVLGPTSNPVMNKNEMDFKDSDYKELMRQEDCLIPRIIEKHALHEKNVYFPYKRTISEIQGAFSIPIRVCKCSVAVSSITIGVNGEMFPCSKFYGMKNWQIGHIESGLDYDRCKKFWRDYRMVGSSNCLSCWVYPVCKGSCPWEAILPDGSFYEKTRFCEYRKNHYERSAYIYSKIQTIEDKKNNQETCN